MNDGVILCPEKFTHPDLDTYDIDLLDYEAKIVDSVLRPILDDKGEKIFKRSKNDLAKIRKHVGEYAWFAEYEQDPHPITGDVWDHIKTVDLLDDPVERKYDICWIGIDRATTTKERSSFTGCPIGLRQADTGFRVITHDFTGKISLEELLIKINNFIIGFKKRYKTMRVIIVVEKQGGGDDFIEMARVRREFLYEGKRVKNEIPILAEIIQLHNVGEKKQRIHDRLYLPIKNELFGIMSNLEYSEVYNEILKYPYYPKLDAIDALANVEFELAKIPLLYSEDPFLEIGKAYDRFENRIEKPWEMLTPDEKVQEILSKTGKGKRRHVFENYEKEKEKHIIF